MKSNHGHGVSLQCMQLEVHRGAGADPGFRGGKGAPEDPNLPIWYMASEHITAGSATGKTSRALW